MKDEVTYLVGQGAAMAILLSHHLALVHKDLLAIHAQKSVNAEGALQVRKGDDVEAQLLNDVLDRNRDRE